MSDKERYFLKMLLLAIGALACYGFFNSKGTLRSAFVAVSGVAFGMGYFL